MKITVAMLATLLGLVVALLSWAAAAHMLMDPTYPADHTNFTTWKQKNGVSCCENDHCKRVELCTLQGGEQGIQVYPGLCIPIDTTKIIHPDTPVDDDGAIYWCGYPIMGNASSNKPTGAGTYCIRIGAQG
jgi:hypothetical protein